MRRLFSFLGKRWVLTLIGTALLSLLIWFEAPLLAFDGKEPFASAGTRWTIIGLLFLAWAAWWAARHVRGLLANRCLAQRLAADDTPSGQARRAAQQDVDALRARMQQAMALLRKSAPGRRGWGSQYLYQLPWYMFVGAPGSGKTTALMHSGLRFPLADTLGAGAIGGIGGTRNCDWWFTDEAVLLDTAGRYTTQDSNAAVDQAGWFGFLSLLKQYRPGRPLNGVVVAVSVADLLQRGPAALQAEAAAVRARIKELHERLGSSFPVYVMVTKCDLLAGFVEYFDHFGREERSQVWGMTFAIEGAAPAAQALASFPQRFETLERQLQARVLERMQQERDLQRRALLYRFPQQFAGLREALAGFLATVFEPTRFEQAALLRGVYFTSGTQEGSPIDRVMAALAGAFGLERKVLALTPGGGRSYFLKDVLSELIFKDAALAGADPRHERRRRRLRLAAAVAGGALLLLLAAGMATSYLRNSAYVEQVAARGERLARMAAATPPQGGMLDILPLLDQARELPGASGGQGAGLLDRFGLNQVDKLGAAGRTAYRRLLRAALLPRVQERLEQVLRRGDANNQEYLYETLRAYLMLGQSEHMDAESLLAWLDLDWRNSLPGSSAEQRDRLAAHAAALFSASADGFDGAPLDARLVAQTRLALARMPLPQRVYNRVKRAVAQARLPEFSVNRAAGRDCSTLLRRASGEPLSRGIDGLYSVAGYRRLRELLPRTVLDIARDGWVLDRRETDGALAALSADQMRDAVLQLYHADYIRQWDAYLADIRMVPLSGLDQAARVTNALAAGDSPLRAFLKAAAQQTSLGAASAQATSRLDAGMRGRLAAAREKLESVLGTAEGAAGNAAAPEVPPNPVDQHFEALHKLVAPAGEGGAQAPLDAMLATLKAASEYFDAADVARRSGAPAPGTESLQRVKREGDGKPAPVAGMLRDVEEAGAGLAQGSERARLQALWKAGGAAFCQQAIAGRYPMVRASSRDVAPEDFGRFFGPGGMMDDFFAKNLAPLVDMAGPRWTWRSGAAEIGIPQEVLNQFQRAARLRDMFFTAGGRQPALRFDLLPLAADPGFFKVQLEIDGQPVVWSAGTQARPVSVVLPSGKGGGQVQFDTTPPVHAGLRTDGAWAWFRMLDKGTLLATSQPERYRLSFDLDGRRVDYQMTASSVVNPFRRDALEQFHCPGGW